MKETTEWKEVTEGKTTLRVPDVEWIYRTQEQTIFYNPAMEINRDLTILSLKTLVQLTERKYSFCDLLAGMGVRSLRIAQEVPEAVDRLVLNDLDEESIKLAKINAEELAIEEKIELRNEEANLLLAKEAAEGERFDIVDLDPFGTPMPFIDSVMGAMKKNAYLFVTATDMPPLCGIYPKVAWRKYGSKTLKTRYCHEVAIRTLLYAVAMSAQRKDYAIKPLFSISLDHYIRVLIKLERKRSKANQQAEKVGLHLHCYKCQSRKLTELLGEEEKNCPNCGEKWKKGGPLWIGE
ncbi:MAG: methyltransferase domain-containing protein, partial [Candidatus Kariarchaeaceae archaeon]